MASDATSLPTNLDATYADDPNDPTVKLHQQLHDSHGSFSNNHPTDTDPHGDRAYAKSYTDNAIATAGTAGLTTAQVNALIATEGVTAVTANYTLLASDAGKEVVVTSATPVAITIPTGLPANQVFGVKWAGAGSVAIIAATGVTMNGISQLAASHLLLGQYARVNIKTYTGNVVHVTGEFSVSASAVMPVPTGTPTPGQVPVVTAASPLALGWGAGGGGSSTLYVGQLRGLTSGSAAQSTSITPGGTVLPLTLPGRVVGLDVAAHPNAVTIPAGLGGDYLVIAKAKVSSSSGTVSLANLTNGRNPTAGGGVTAVGGRARFTTGNTGGYASGDHVSRTFGTAPLSTANVSITVDFDINGEAYPCLWARADHATLDGNNAYQLAVNDAGTQLILRKFVGGVAASLGTYALQMPIDATVGRLRLDCVGTAIKGWMEIGTATLGAANINATDSAVTAAGFCGFEVGGGGPVNSGSYAEIDNVVITDGAGSPTTLLTDTFSGAAPTLDQKSLSITVNGSVVETVTENAAAPRLENTSYLTLNAGDYVGLKADGPTAYTVEALVPNDVSLTLVKQ